ncbi:MAG: UDP-N-acetylmuramate dehydrogenase [bacterium]|nr:UDP-N-acetylmuramate dehydrogenase [bacterium]
MNIHIEENVNLAQFTTMRVGGNARFFVRVASANELKEAVFFAREKKLPIFVLGGGSNTLVSGTGFPGLVMKIEIKGVDYSGTKIVVGAGEVWDEVVRDVVAHNMWGIENLSLIPGSVGGAVVQNVGAYGMEARETIFSVEALDTKTMAIKTFLNSKCEFGYRESIFKKNKNLIVLRTTLDLKEDSTPRTDYEDVKKYLAEQNISAPTLSMMRDIIIAIRTAKLPQPPLGTAGSFFKNPVVSSEQYEKIKKAFPEMKAYIQGDGTVKLSGAWLLDHVGRWKGVRTGDVGVHEKQALILVNYGSANADEIILLASEMKKSIKEKTGVTLEEEVVLL